MPSQKPRLNLTLDEDMNDLITELAELRGIPKTRVITDILQDILPAIVIQRDSLRLYNDQKSALPNLARIAALANTNTAIMNNEMAELFKQYYVPGANDD